MITADWDGWVGFFVKTNICDLEPKKCFISNVFQLLKPKYLKNLMRFYNIQKHNIIVSYNIKLLNAEWADMTGVQEPVMHI